MLKDKDWTQATAEPDRPLPDGLKSRLKAIPRQVMACRETDLLYRAARRQAAGQATEPVVTEHLQTCSRCRSLFETLLGAFSERPSPLPSPLTTRLRRIARRPPRRSPDWIAEPRLAAAACILMTVVLSSMATDAVAMLRDAGGTVSAQAAEWTEEGSVRGRQMWKKTAAATISSYEISRQQLTGFVESCGAFYNDTIRAFGSITNREDETSDGGPPDGKSNPTE